MYNGVLIIDKPEGFTSFDAVAKIRSTVRQKKIGHAGTLDPLATGVLVVLLGNATKASEYASGKKKEYIAHLKLGLCTDTQDITGKVLSQSEVTATQEDLELALSAFRGEIKQVPPMFSALSQGGTRLYKLARQGIETERQAREIEIEKLTLTGKIAENEYELDVVCSKGTYIRTLCADIGQALSCGGCMSALRRVAVGDFEIKNALTLSQVREYHENGTLSEHIIPTDRLFSEYPQVILNEEGEKRAANGAFILPSGIKNGELPEENAICRVYSQNGEFLMLCRGGTLDIGKKAMFCHKTFRIQG